MREAIEVVIEDLEDKAKYNTNSTTVSALKYAIRQLKGVLTQHETDNSNRANGNGADDRGDGQTNQVETVRPG